MSGVGEEVKRLRQAKGWTQEQLAVYAGSSQPTVNLLEAGKRNPSATTLEKLARALEVEVVDLFPKAQAQLPLNDPADVTGDPVEAATMIRALASTAAELAGAWNQDVGFYEQHGRRLLPYRTLEMGLAVEGLYHHFWRALSVLQHHAESLGLNPDPATWELQSKELLIEAGSNIRALADLRVLIERSATATDADRENLRARRAEFGGSTLAGLEILARDPRWPEAREKARTEAGVAQ
jgi:transcriptional regulator with XRE-family HTH domain